jgi:hypothetical protein
MKFTKTIVTAPLAIALAMLATPAMAEIVLVPGVGARTVVTCCGNHPNAPRVYAPGPNEGPPIGPHSHGTRPYYAPRPAPAPMLQRRVVPYVGTR